MADDEMTQRGSDVVDPRGEQLTSDLLPDDVATYEIAPDETEAEELDLREPVAADEMVSDAEQLEDATRVADATPSTRPRKRKQARAEAALLEADPEPASTGSTVATTSLRPRRVPEKKDHATPAQRRKAPTEVRAKRVGLGQFIQECVDELRKVVWPTGEQLGQYFVVVLLFVLFIIAIVSGLDLLFGWALLKLLG